VLSGYTDSHVSSIHDFDSITPLFSDHTPNIGVPENNGVMLLKSRMKDEGLEKAIRGGVSESQSKFLAGTLPIS
jgi:hypothetical protein